VGSNSRTSALQNQNGPERSRARAVSRRFLFAVFYFPRLNLRIMNPHPSKPRPNRDNVVGSGIAAVGLYVYVTTAVALALEDWAVMKAPPVPPPEKKVEVEARILKLPPPV